MAEGKSYKTERCAKCKYHGLVNARNNDKEKMIICEYILYGKGRRDCSGEHCDKFEPMDGKTMKEKRRPRL